MTMEPTPAAATTTTTNKTKKKKSKKDKTAKKKRKISKHILQANKDRADLEKARAAEAALPLDESQVDAATAGALTKTSTNKKDKNKSALIEAYSHHHTKDVKEAAGYLSNWKNYREQWKFNKNTQSWLIRHMYESDKVAKGTFIVLLEYLQGLQGKGAKDRILQDATKRALRYKRFEGKQGGDNNPQQQEEEKEKTVKFSDDTKDDGRWAGDNDDINSRKKKKPKQDPTSSEDEKRWNELNDHDKRKEYKRARKILETIKGE